MEEPGGYLFRVSMNLFRSRRRRAAVALRRMVVPGAPAADAFEAVDDRTVVLRALSDLVPEQRAALVVTGLYGLSSDEAAEVLGVQPSTVRARASRARAALREAIGEVRSIDERDVLERALRGFVPEPGMTERVFRRRERKRRNQRIRAGVLGAAVAVAVALVGARSLVIGDVPMVTPAPTPPSPATGQIGFIGVPPRERRRARRSPATSS